MRAHQERAQDPLPQVDLDYIRAVTVKLLESEEIDTYLPVLQRLLNFSEVCAPPRRSAHIAIPAWRAAS